MKNPDVIRKALKDPVARLLRAVRAVAAMYDREFPAGGLRSTHFMLIMMLNNRNATAERQLGRALAIERPTLVRSLALLERYSLIVAQSGSGRSNRLWRLTARGQREIARLRPYWERAETRLKQAVGKKDWMILHAILDRVTQMTDEGR